MFTTNNNRFYICFNQFTYRGFQYIAGLFAIAMNNIQKYAEDENMIGRVIVKEVYLSIGRCFGMFLIVMSSWILPENLYLPVSVIFCSLFPLILYWYAKNHQSVQNVD